MSSTRAYPRQDQTDTGYSNATSFLRSVSESARDNYDERGLLLATGEPDDERLSDALLEHQIRRIEAAILVPSDTIAAVMHKLDLWLLERLDGNGANADGYDDDIVVSVLADLKRLAVAEGKVPG